MSTKTVVNPDGSTVIEKTPEPALKATSVVGVINTIAAALATFGLTTWSGKLSGWAETIATIVVGVFTLAVHLGAGAWIRARVVPIESVAKTTQGQLGAVLENLGPIMAEFHLTNNKVVQALEQLAYPSRSISVGQMMSGGGGGGNAVATFQESTPLFGNDGISDEPDPEPEDDGISEDQDPEPAEVEPDKPGADEVPPPGVAVLASHAKDPTNPPEHSPR